MTMPRRSPLAASWLGAAALAVLPAASRAQDRMADPTRSTDTAASHTASALENAKGERDASVQASADLVDGGPMGGAGMGRAEPSRASAEKPATNEKPAGPAYTLWKLHQANQMEMQMGELAKAQARSPEVKRYGQRLVADHTGADAKVKTWAGKLKVDLDQKPSASDKAEMDEDMAKMDQLKAMKGADFDGKFVQTMADGHKKVIALVAAAQNEAGQKEIRPLLDELLPKLRQHEQIALRLADGHGDAAEKPAGRAKTR